VPWCFNDPANVPDRVFAADFTLDALFALIADLFEPYFPACRFVNTQTGQESGRDRTAGGAGDV